MTPICRNVLKNLRLLAQNEDTELCFLGGTCYIALSDDLKKYYDYSKYSGEISSIISALVGDGYLTYGVNEYHFSLTHKGLHPYLMQWVTLKHFLFTSVAVPIAVSVATSLIVLWLQGSR